MFTLIVGDPHVRPSNLSDFQEFTAKTIEIAKNNKCQRVVILGDVFNDHSHLHVRCVKAVADWLDALVAAVTGTVHVLVGNHDKTSGADSVTLDHALYPFKGRHPRLIVVDSPVSEGDRAYLPHLSDLDFNRTVEEIPQSVRLGFAHQEISGCKLGVRISTSLSQWSHPGILVCGHVHERHIVGRVHYVGTPMAHSFAEAEEKGLTLLNDDTLEMTFVSTGLPRRITHTMTASDSFPARQNEQDYVRYVVTDSPDALRSFRASKEYKSISSHPRNKIVQVATRHEVQGMSAKITFKDCLKGLLVNAEQGVQDLAKELEA